MNQYVCCWWDRREKELIYKSSNSQTYEEAFPEEADVLVLWLSASSKYVNPSQKRLI